MPPSARNQIWMITRDGNTLIKVKLHCISVINAPNNLPGKKFFGYFLAFPGNGYSTPIFTNFTDKQGLAHFFQAWFKFSLWLKALGSSFQAIIFEYKMFNPGSSFKLFTRLQSGSLVVSTNDIKTACVSKGCRVSSKISSLARALEAVMSKETDRTWFLIR